MTFLNDITVINLPFNAFGDMRTAEISPLFQHSFEYTVDNTELMTQLISGSATITQSQSMGVLSTTTTTASDACLQTKHQTSYRSGLGGLLRFSTLFTTGVTGTEQYSGLADELGSSATFNNGYMVGFDGDTFGFHRFSNDTKTSVAQSSWDDPLDGTGESGITLDPTKLNAWEIRVQYPAGVIILAFSNPDTGIFITVHTIKYANVNTEPSVRNPNFRGTFWVDNGATTIDIVSKTASVGYFIEGKTEFTEIHQPEFSSDFQFVTGITTEIALFTIRNKTTYAGKTNFVDIVIESFTAAVEASAANNLAEVKIIKNATVGGTPVFSDINTSNSVMEIDTAGTTVTGGLLLSPVPLAGKNDKTGGNLLPFKILLGPDESLTISAASANSATISASVLWKELF